MSMVNYVKEHKRFIEYASDEQLSSAERLLWYALMHIFNQRAEGRNWPDGFIKVPNDRVLSFFPGQRDALLNARNRLKQRGLIDFKPGEKNRKPAMYKMNYFFPQDGEAEGEDEEQTECLSGKTTKTPTRTTRKKPTRTSAKIPTIDINIKENGNEEQKPERETAPAQEGSDPSFRKPTAQEVEAYCREKGYRINARRFTAFYDAIGWMDKRGVPILNWKSKADAWAELPYDRPGGGRTVPAQQYTQRSYTEEELLAVSDDLIEEARRLRDEPE